MFTLLEFMYLLLILNWNEVLFSKQFFTCDLLTESYDLSFQSCDVFYHNHLISLPQSCDLLTSIMLSLYIYHVNSLHISCDLFAYIMWSLYIYHMISTSIMWSFYLNHVICLTISHDLFTSLQEQQQDHCHSTRSVWWFATFAHAGLGQQ